MGSGVQTAAYLLAGILFIKSLGGLSDQESAKKGNLYGIIGMAIAILATLAGSSVGNMGLLILVLVVAAVIGWLMAKKVEMTQMPQLVALLHSFVGLAAVLVAVNSYLNPGDVPPGAEHTIHIVEIFLGVFIGAITFTGSLVAFGKLQGSLSGTALKFKGKHLLNISLVVACLYLGYLFLVAEGTSGMNALLIMTGLSGLLGVLLVMEIGGADMPVVVSMLNSYSGWAAAATGFMLSNDLLIITGALVGSSGAILSYIMCEAMNRSFLSVIFGGFGEVTVSSSGASEVQGEIIEIKSPQVSDLLKNSKKIVIVPGYGMAVAKAQYMIADMTKKLRSQGKQVKFAIHPVAGRLPGHMNVLLAEANVPYDIVHEMDEINDELDETDVVLVVGANDIVNPSALDDASSPIFGMPVIEVWDSKNVIVLKRGMSAGYAGVQNPLFFKENTSMFFGDAKASIESLKV